MRLPSTVLVALAFAATCAATVSLAPPAPEWVDCEAATNAALPSATWQRRGHFDVRLSVAAGTNHVQAAFGRDADGDGKLSYEETALVVGCDADEVFFEDVAARRRRTSPRVGGMLRRCLRLPGVEGSFCASSSTGRASRPDCSP